MSDLRRLVSLREMIEIRPELMPAYGQIVDFSRRLKFILGHGFNEGREAYSIPIIDSDMVRHHVDAISYIAAEMGFIVTKGAAEELQRRFNQNEFDWSSLSRNQMNLLVSMLSNIINPFLHEANLRKIYIVDAVDSDFLLDAASIFGQDVVSAFPASASELEEGCKCIAFGRWTAAVVHFMRALETPLLALESAVQVNVPKEQWDQKINQIESKLKEIRKSNEYSKEDERFFSQTATNFRFLKDAWRNYAAHSNEFYSENETRIVYLFVKSFLIHLSSRLSS